MKKILMMSLMVFAAGLLGFTWVPQADAAEPRSYLMMCQGGGDMIAIGVHRHGFQRRLRNGSYKRVRGDSSLSISFSKSPVAAETRQPGPGQCAWMRRSLNQNEPARMFFNHDDAGTVSTWKVTYQDKPVSAKIHRLRSTGNFIKSELTFKNSNSQTLIDAVRNGSRFYVHVYNDRGQRMVITRVGQ